MIGEHFFYLFFGNGGEALKLIRGIPFILSADVSEDVVDILEGLQEEALANFALNFGFEFEFLIFINILVDQV